MCALFGPLSRIKEASIHIHVCLGFSKYDRLEIQIGNHCLDAALLKVETYIACLVEEMTVFAVRLGAG